MTRSPSNTHQKSESEDQQTDSEEDDHQKYFKFGKN